MSVNTNDIAALVAKIRSDIATLAARDPEHGSTVEGLVFTLLGRAICGDAAGPFILAALDVRSRPGSASGNPTPAPEAAGHGDDAAIVAMVDEMRGLEAATDALCDKEDDLPDFHPDRAGIRAEAHKLSVRHWEIREALAQLQAATMDGFRAKAWVARHFCDLGTGEFFDPRHDEAVAWSLAGDLLGLPAEKMPSGGEAGT